MIAEPLATSWSLCGPCQQNHQEATQALIDLALEEAVNLAIEEAA